MRTRGAYQIRARWDDDSEEFTAIISDDNVLCPNMRESDKRLIVDLTPEEIQDNGLFTIISMRCLHTLN